MTDKELMVELTAKDIVAYLMDDYQLDMPSALRTLYRSKTFEKLEDARTGFCYQSPAYVYHHLKGELNTKSNN